MNEFIVWDKELEFFGESNKYLINCNGDLFFDNNDKYLYNQTDKLVACNYIGLKDINNNKIYADCSIVEFDFEYKSTQPKRLENGLSQSTVYSQIQKTKLKGWFEYNNEELRYEINILNDSDFICLWYQIGDMRNLKIIDTIQENKLGLIK